MADSVSADEKQNPPHLFQPGQSGNPNGRPKGSRNKLGENFLAALNADFDANGVEAIEQVRKERPHEYLKVIASILPKELKLSTPDDLTDDELDRRISQLLLGLGNEMGIGGTTGDQGPETPQEPAPSLQTLQ